MKLELNHLKHYLGTGLACKLKFDGKQDLPWYYEKDEDDLFQLEGMMLDWYGNAILEIKPILLPLSALTEPIEDGIVPIVELAKMAEMLEPISFDKMEDHVRLQRGVTAKDRFNHQWLMFDFKHGFSMWHKPHNEPDHRPTLLDNQLQLFEYLFANHFDVYGLLDANLAIDKRTLK